MNPLTLNAVGPVTLSALSALRPVPTVTNPANGAGGPNGTALLGLAQDLFQRALQVTPVVPLTEPATTGLNQTQEATASLLAALNAPQAGANATPAAQARTTAANAALAAITKANAAANTAALDAMTNPAATPATPAAPTPPATPVTVTPSPVTNPAETVLGNLTPAQDAFTNAASPDFALQTALRFGAGVGPLAAPAIANPGQGTGLVRDATEVLRIRNLQPQTGGPGPQAFAQPQVPVQHVLQSYQAVPAAQTPGQVDLLA